MNYRHVFHAGNFADVFKHAVLALCVAHLAKKAAPFRIIDTHAGPGRYDLAGVEAGKTLEWIDGVGRLLGVDAAPIPAPAQRLLAPYLDCVAALNPEGRLSAYPGSPLIARSLLRTGDRLIVNELHADDRDALAALFAADASTKVLGLDGWTALKALLPPKERRGLTLVDPPFEERDDFRKLGVALADARRRFQSGAMILWYPIKDQAAVADFHCAVRAVGFENLLRAELLVRRPADETRFNGCGLLIVNPPWTLRGDLEILGPFLATRLAQGQGASFALGARRI